MKNLTAAAAALIAVVAVAGCSAEGDNGEGSKAATSTESQTTTTTGPDAFSGNAVRLASELEPHIGKQPPEELESFAQFSCDIVEKGSSLADAASNVDLMFGETWNYPDEGVVIAASFSEYCPELLPDQTPSQAAAPQSEVPEILQQYASALIPDCYAMSAMGEAGQQTCFLMNEQQVEGVQKHIAGLPVSINRDSIESAAEGWHESYADWKADGCVTADSGVFCGIYLMIGDTTVANMKSRLEP